MNNVYIAQAMQCFLIYIKKLCKSDYVQFINLLNLIYLFIFFS